MNTFKNRVFLSKTFEFQLNRLYKYTRWTSDRNTPFLFLPRHWGLVRLPPPLVYASAYLKDNCIMYQFTYCCANLYTNVTVDIT